MDLRTCALLGTMRGNNFSKIKDKSTPELKTAMTGWSTADDFIDGTPQKPEDMTLSRVAAALVEMIHKGIARGAWTITTTIDPDRVARGFPKSMCIPTFASLIPAEHIGVPRATKTALFYAFLYHQYLFDKVINHKKNRVTAPAQIEEYGHTQVNSQLHADDLRLNILVSTGILLAAEPHKLNPDLKTPITSAAKSWIEVSGISHVLDMDC